MNNNLDLVTIYARAFFLLGKEKKIDWKESLTIASFLLRTFANCQTPFNKWLQSLSLVQMKRELQIIFKNTLPKVWLHLMLVLIADYNFSLFPAILKTIKTFLHQKLDIQIAHLYSVVPLNDQQLNTIKDKLQQRLHCRIELQAKLDVSLIGGVKVQINNQIFDNSLQKKLTDFRMSVL